MWIDFDKKGIHIGGKRQTWEEFWPDFDSTVIEELEDMKNTPCFSESINEPMIFGKTARKLIGLEGTYPEEYKQFEKGAQDDQP